ncbi:CcoQ/FixQ family Cbb3-type cytochrome c oxidase assembly chaperone [Aestuariibacter sp. AA17]|uniref:CcoQ/FixQ family Cbb3-type cytochrome c oxidase assembly chaperone n=1 Tax=Fluctibacter corallii TaxID=2984329 RepID=A0ABT3A6A3_9ALTE|nr:CcoQ/FixQ family Cbb3-type cytochrome c oxidase assembly chaperone [Aestuariibacter sp. AA17]MCV2884208.1 CcoQ/FixQ family Cbb3-type cytochrome c oxidase assembly chaperone [Aestuariibacter sp. AA17]
MDFGTVGSIFTVVVFVCFAGVVWWAFSKRNKDSFDEAANLVFDDEKEQQTTEKKRESSK